MGTYQSGTNCIIIGDNQENSGGGSFNASDPGFNSDGGVYDGSGVYY
jgi:hypothetical protein